MLRLALLGFCYAVVTLPASADDITYTFEGTLPAFTLSGSGNCFGPPLGMCPSGSGVALDFTLPQFNPSLGTLNSFGVSLEGFTTIDGTFTNSPITGCTGICPNDGGADMLYNVTGSFTAAGSTFPVSTTPADASFLVPIGPDGGTGGGSAGVDSQGGGSNLAPNGAVTGTGNLRFDLFSAINPDVITADEAYSITVEPANLNASVTYDYTPSPAPEPSFFAITGALFGLSVWRVRKRKALHA